MKKRLIKLLIAINRFIPKHKVNHRVLVFCDMGIGDLVMLMPTLRELHACGFELVFHTTKPVIKTILQTHLPWKDYFKEPRCTYGWSLCNFHTVYYREILCIMRNRIPNRVAHDHYLYYRFFNKCVPFNKYSAIHKQPVQNMLLCEPFNVKPTVPKLFFYTYPPAHTGAIVIQAFSYTDPRKECMDWMKIAFEYPRDVVIFIGHKNEDHQFLPGINLIGQLNILETAGIIKAAKHFYCLESGLAHIAAAVGTPTTVYYRRSITREHCLHRNLKHMTYIGIDG